MVRKQDKTKMEIVKRSQRYLCIYCDKTYVTMPKWRRYDEETKKQAIELYIEGNSERAIGRILGISINTCIY